ncbi:MAG: branched-chain amino acid ABC transporter permease [Acidimicrobiales bacterium]
MTAAVLGAISSDAWFEAIFSGIALGAKYALVALGFVIVFKATGVINFAQASFVLLGGYFCWNFSATWGWNFYVSLVAAMVGGALVGLLLELLILRHMSGEAPFTLIMVTIGILFVIDNLVTAVWGAEGRDLPDPWGLDTYKVGEVDIAVADVWTIGITAVVLGAFFAFFRLSTLGLAMRASALDQEAAMAQGIDPRRVYQVAWACAGAVGAVAGVMLASGSGSLNPALGLIALVAFPAMILGGLESPGGAVVGGLIIGLVQQLTALLAPEYFEWLGSGFETVSPYLVMVIILLVRPSGLFGEKEVRRV